MRSISTIAREIRRTWERPSFGAVPYLDAMLDLQGPNDAVGRDSAKVVVCYFLANAGMWKGPDARRIKAELKSMFNLRR